jgi:probable HAF family extracellular repeat protein
VLHPETTSHDEDLTMTPRPRPHASGARGTTACSFGSRIAAALMTTCVFVAAGVPVVADGQRPLHAIHLGTLGSGISRATGVNDHGQVVGWSRSAEGVTHAFIWTAAAGMRDLGTLGGDFSSAVAINNSGLTIGDSRTADGLSHAVAWTAAAGAIDLVPQSACSTAVALNDTGMVVGWFNTSDAFCNTRSSHAFVWTAASGAIDIGTLGGAASYATAVNGQGMVVGGSTIPGDAATHAFAWSPARSMTDLGTIGGNFAEALAVNDAGMVTGAATIAGDTARHPFVWTDADGMIDLGRSGFPRGINNRGVVVGAFATVDGGACLFDFLSCDPHGPQRTG